MKKGGCQAGFIKIHLAAVFAGKARGSYRASFGFSKDQRVIVLVVEKIS